MRRFASAAALSGAVLFACAFDSSSARAQNLTTPPASPTAAPTFAPQFYQTQGVQQQLNLTPNQLQRMNDLYSQTNNQYQKRFNDFNNLTPQERADRMRALATDFNTQYSKSLGSVLSEQQMQRYNQLSSQYRGFDLFADPAIQKQLNLTTEQADQLRRADTDYQRELSELSKVAGTNRADATRRYGDLAQRRASKMNSILTAQQQQQYQALTGEPYNFPPAWEL